MVTCAVQALVKAVPDSTERFLKLEPDGVERPHQLSTFCGAKAAAECRDIKFPEDIVEALTLVQPVL